MMVLGLGQFGPDLFMHILGMTTGQIECQYYTSKLGPKSKPKGRSGGKTKSTSVGFGFFHPNRNKNMQN